MFKLVRILLLSSCVYLISCTGGTTASAVALNSVESSREIVITIKELTDNTGLVYLGGTVDSDDVTNFLSQMNTLLEGKFEQFRASQIKRDHGQFHITLINPFEYQELNADKVKSHLFGKEFRFNLIGLGTASNEKSSTYFVIAESEQAQQFRTQFLLKPKDFHVTLGFLPSDVFGVNKDRRALIGR